MRKFALLLLAACVSFLFASAQEKTITGKITEANGSPIPNASIRVKGSKNGTSADASGSFTIKAAANATLVVSAVGFESKEVSLSNEASLTITLAPDTKALSEVVVTGIGVATSKKKLGIAVESITSDKLPAAPTASVDQALVGKIPGAQISSTNGSPGRPVNIVLRGINTINRGTSPVILLDGVQVSTDLNSLDLSGIERIEVAQGSAAATIYGAQGANGVIQLFSKKGKNGKVRIDVSSNVSVNTMLNNGGLGKAMLHPFTTNPAGEVIGSSGNLITLDPATSIYKENVQVNLVDPNTKTEKAYNKNLRYYDHYKMFLQDAYTTNNAITISGAKEKIDFSLTLSDNRQTSTFKNNGKFSRSNFLSNLGVELAKNLKFRSITQLVFTKNTLNDGTGRGIFFALNNSRPFANYDYQMPDGNYGYYFGDATGVNGYNPNYRTQYSNSINDKIDVVQSFNLNYKPSKFLELDAKYGLNYQTQDIVYDVKPQDDNASAKFWGTRWWTGNYAPTPSVGTSGSIDNFRYRTTFQNFLASATINTDFKRDFNINLPIKTTTLLTFDYRKNLFKEYITWGADAPFYTPYTASQMVTYRIQLDRTTPFVTYGYLATQRIEYGEIAGVSGGLRSDYSSAFGRGSKAFTFGRGDAYIRLSSFNFWQDSKLGSIITEFKLRSAIGQAGIQPEPFDRYKILNTANLGSNVAFTLPTIDANPDLNVEVSTEYEVGTDITIKALKGNWLSNINFSTTFWKRTTDNAIYDIDAAPSTGSGRIKDNAFGLASNGLQASLNVNVFKHKKLTWDFTANFGKQTSKITFVKGGTEIVVLSNAGSSNYVLKPGEKIGQLYGNLLIKAVDQIDPATGNPYIPKASQANYVVASNGWVVDKNTKQPFVTPGKVSFGDPNPKFNMSFINDVTFFNNLSINMQWDWVYGSHLYNQTKQWMYRDGIHKDYAKPITINGQTGAWTAFYRGVYAQVQANGTRNYFYEDASFFRLRNLAVAYDFAKLVNKPFLQKLQLVVLARNAVTFTKYTGMDPEVSSGTSNSAFDRGVDHNTIPNLKTYQIGLNVGF